MRTPSTEAMPVLRDVIRRAACFEPLVEALKGLQRLAWGDVSGHSIEAYKEAKAVARAALAAAEEATR